MIESYSNNITVASNSVVPLNVSFVKGKTAVKTGDGSIKLAKCGIYDISVSASGVANSGGNMTLQLVVNGIPVPNAFASETAGDTTSLHSLSFTTKVQVPASANDNCPCSLDFTISLVNTGVPTTFSLVNVLVTKLV